MVADPFQVLYSLDLDEYNSYNQGQREQPFKHGLFSTLGEGLWSYYSYRDPNTAATLDVYDRALDWINSSNSFTDKDIDEAKMKLFSSLDHPLPPSSQGMACTAH